MTKKINVIVLDFDGTLFPRRFFDTGSGADPVLANIIKRLCLEQDFKLVLSASLQSDEEKAKETLIEAGLNPSWLWDVSWRTRDVELFTVYRHQQIEVWYEYHKHLLDEVIVLDDDHCPLTSPISEFWYKCDSENGLTFANLINLYGIYL